MAELQREKSMVVFAMNLLCTDEERREGRGTWTLLRPVPVVGMDGKCITCKGFGKMVVRGIIPHSNPPQATEQEQVCVRCQGKCIDGSPTYTIEEFVIEGSVIHTFCRNKQTSKGEEIVHSPFMVHSLASYAPIPVWRECQDAEAPDPRQRVDLVIDIEGEIWEIDKTVPSKHGQPGNARIVRMFNTGDSVHIYAEPDHGEIWSAMRASLRQHPHFAPSGDFGIMFSLMSLSTRLVRATSDVIDYKDIREEAWQRSEMMRLGTEEEDDDDEEEEDDDEEVANAALATNVNAPAAPAAPVTPPIPVPINGTITDPTNSPNPAISISNPANPNPS